LTPTLALGGGKGGDLWGKNPQKFVIEDQILYERKRGIKGNLANFYRGRGGQLAAKKTAPNGGRTGISGKGSEISSSAIATRRADEYTVPKKG